MKYGEKPEYSRSEMDGQHAAHTTITVRFIPVAAGDVVNNKRLRINGTRLGNIPACGNCLTHMTVITPKVRDTCPFCDSPKPFFYMSEIASTLPEDKIMFRLKVVKKQALK